MVESVEERLGVGTFGSDAPVGNVLAYPRRIILEVFRLLLTREDFFAPISSDGSPTQRNPFLLKYEADGVTLAKDSRMVLTDYGSEKLSKEENRPRIVVTRGGGSFATDRLNSQQFTAFSGIKDSRKFAALFGSSVIIRCVSRVRAESEMLALIAMMALTFFNREIKQQSHIEHISMPEVGETVLEKANGDAEQWTTTVQVRVSQTITWTLAQINTTVLNEICVQVAL